MATPTYLFNDWQLNDPGSWPEADCSQIDSGDTAWMLVCTGSVLLMTVSTFIVSIL